MTPTARTPLRAAALSLLAVVTLTGCGPETKVELGVRAAPVSITFGGKSSSPQPTPPTLRIPNTGPGFIAPPQRLDQPAAPVAQPQPTAPGPGVLPPPPVPESCPLASVNAPVEEAAPSIVSKAPKEGTYRYRRSGVLQVGAPGDDPAAVLKRPRQQLSPLVLQQVTNVQETPVPGTAGPRITWDSVLIEPGLKTTTSYLVDPVGTTLEPRASAGLKITRIVVQRTDLPADGPLGAAGEDEVETFEPQPPIKIMNFPAVAETAPDPNGYSTGADPSTGATMRVFSAIQGRARVDACGRVVQGWRVKVSFADDGTGPRDSSYERPAVRNYKFGGEFVFAPQFSMFLSESLTFTGMDVGNRPYRLASTSIVNGLDPS